MKDPIFIFLVGLGFVLLMIAVIGRRNADKPASMWRKNVAGSLWALNAMLFGGVADPVEKGKVVKVRSRDSEQDDPDFSDSDA